MGIKLLNRDSLLDFPNVSGPNGSNSDSEASRGGGYPPFHRRVFHSSSVVFSSVTTVSVT